MNSTTIFHRAFTKEIKKFRVGSHFGNSRQAIVAIAAHLFIDGCKEETAYLYECDIAASDCEYVSTDDWGSPKIQALLYAYLGAVGETLKFATEYQRGITSSKCSETKSMEYLSIEINMRKHVGIKYQNAVECLGESVCILDPKRLVIKSVTAIKKCCITKAFSGLNSKQFGISEEDFSFAIGRAQSYCPSAA